MKLKTAIGMIVTLLPSFSLYAANYNQVAPTTQRFDESASIFTGTDAASKRQFDAFMKRADQQIANYKARTSSMDDAAKSDAKSSIEDLERARNNLREEYRKLQAARADDRAEAMSRFNDSYSTFTRDLNELNH